MKSVLLLLIIFSIGLTNINLHASGNEKLITPDELNVNSLEPIAIYQDKDVFDGDGYHPFYVLLLDDTDTYHLLVHVYTDEDISHSLLELDYESYQFQLEASTVGQPLKPMFETTDVGVNISFQIVQQGTDEIDTEITYSIIEYNHITERIEFQKNGRLRFKGQILSVNKTDEAGTLNIIAYNIESDVEIYLQWASNIDGRMPDWPIRTSIQYNDQGFNMAFADEEDSKYSVLLTRTTAEKGESNPDFGLILINEFGEIQKRVDFYSDTLTFGNKDLFARGITRIKSDTYVSLQSYEDGVHSGNHVLRFNDSLEVNWRHDFSLLFDIEATFSTERDVLMLGTTERRIATATASEPQYSWDQLSQEGEANYNLIDYTLADQGVRFTGQFDPRVNYYLAEKDGEVVVGFLGGPSSVEDKRNIIATTNPLNIYPTVTSGAVNLTNKEGFTAKPEKARLIRTDGSQVMDIEGSQIDLAGLSNGIYYIVYTYNGAEYSQAIIKE